MTPFESSVLASIEEMNVKIGEWKRRLAAKQALSQMANSYCLEEDWRRNPVVQIVPSHRRQKDGSITRKWVINSGPGSFVQFLAAEGTDCWVFKGSDEGDLLGNLSTPYGGIKRFDTPEEAYEEWTTKHREPWRAAMKELGWKFWGEEE